MYALVTILPEPISSLLKSLWGELAEECALTGVEMTPIPHFSWLVMEGYDQSKMSEFFGRKTIEALSFSAQTSGLGLFTGESPVAYIPLVKDSNLLSCHARLWDCLKDIMTGVNTFYNPDNWLPHITIAYGDVDLVKLVCLVEKLASRSFNWTFPVDNLALIGQQEGKMREILLQHVFC